MPHYYFDTRDDGEFVCDDVGVELPGIQEATRVAARSLAELALEVLPSSTARCLGVDVRDDQQRDVLTTELTYKAIIHAPGRLSGGETACAAGGSHRLASSLVRDQARAPCDLPVPGGGGTLQARRRPP